MNAAERFMRFVSPEPNTGCWIWTGHTIARGTDPAYGQFAVSRTDVVPAHRFAFRFFRGEPGDRDVHHGCGVRLCVNPSHLEALSTADHAARHRSMRCRQGHLLTPENVYVRKDKPGARRCRTCQREAVRRATCPVTP